MERLISELHRKQAGGVSSEKSKIAESEPEHEIFFGPETEQQAHNRILFEHLSRQLNEYDRSLADVFVEIDTDGSNTIGEEELA
jgi:hypothetical protein